MKHAADHSDFMTTHQAGRILDLGPGRIRQLANSGHLPVIRIAGIRFFKRADVERFKRERAKAKKAALLTHVAPYPSTPPETSDAK